jgi:capsular exopolysaccharide synthesis family protein
MYKLKRNDTVNGSAVLKQHDNVHHSRSQQPDNKVLFLNKTKNIPVDKTKLKKRRIYIDAEDRKSAVAISAYKYLRTSVLKKLSKLDVRSLMVTSPTKGAGKTTTAINLAVNIARHGSKTALLVDLDLRAPSIHQYLDYNPDYGIVDVVQGRVTLENALVTPGIDRLSILMGKERYEDSSELLTSNAMRMLIDEVRNRYEERIVIFDMPPMLGCDDVAAVAPIMDACLVVIEEEKSQYSELQESLDRIEDVAIVGYVLNKSKEVKIHRYYY